MGRPKSFISFRRLSFWEGFGLIYWKRYGASLISTIQRAQCPPQRSARSPGTLRHTFISITVNKQKSIQGRHILFVCKPVRYFSSLALDRTCIQIPLPRGLKIC